MNKPSLFRRGEGTALAAMGIVGFLMVGCSAKPREAEQLKEPHCELPEKSVGSWSVLRQPDEVLDLNGNPSRFTFSDGETLSLQHGYYFARLEGGEMEWEVGKTSNLAPIGGWMIAAAPDFLVQQGGYDNRVKNVLSRNLSLLDLQSKVWSEVVPPEDIILDHSAFGAFSWGQEFFFFDESQILHEDGVSEEFVGSAVAFNPYAGTWRQLPLGYTGERTSVVDREQGGYWLHSAFEGSSLFAWGTLPGWKKAFGLHLDLETEIWTASNEEHGPSPRRDYDLVVVAGGAYLVGGYTKDELEPIDELWFYDFIEQSWQAIEVPEFVDPRRGVWLDGRLYIFGYCASDAIYDPDDQTWEQMAPLDIPQVGTPVVAGGRIFITQVINHPDDESRDLFIYDPKGSPSAN